MNDFYPTPPEVTAALLDFLHIPKCATIWEPACGDGAMVRVMKDYGYWVLATDIQYGTDFLGRVEAPQYDWIITNPPFSLAEQFIRRANEVSSRFAFLLKCQYWHSAKRRKLFEEIPPRYVLPLTWRPDFTGQGSSLMDMMWCVWEYPGESVTATLYKPLEKPTM